jgi:hypothetical protein
LTEICNSGSGDGTDCLDGTIDLSVLVPKYLSAIPTDPNGHTASTTGYHIALNSSHKPYLRASNTEITGTYIAIGSGTGVANPCDHSVSNPSCWSVSSRQTWGPAPSTTGVSADITLANGKENTAILAGLDGDYPAADYCYNLTEGGVPVGTWYLPSYAELMAGWLALGHDVFAGNYYWSSTEWSSINHFGAWVLFADPQTMAYGMDYEYKGYSRWFHCLR